LTQTGNFNNDYLHESVAQHHSACGITVLRYGRCCCLNYYCK
jgi:hypothetical protein